MVDVPIIVSELSINHLGMVNIAKKMINSSIESGANLIKLKYKNVKKYYNRENNKTWRNFDFITYRESLELSKEDFIEIASYCSDNGVSWFCTVHDSEGLEFISSMNPPYYKVASMDAGRESFVDDVIKVCKQKQKPLIISLGGKDDVFTKDLVHKINLADLNAFLLHTVSIYPTPIGRSNINYIHELKRLYENDRIKIGYSGHEVGYSASIVAFMMGVSMIERHFTLSRNYNIHHIKCALTPNEFRDMVNHINEIRTEINQPKASYNEEELDFLINKKYK